MRTGARVCILRASTSAIASTTGWRRNIIVPCSFLGNGFTQIDIELSNPRPAPEEEVERPGLIRPTLGPGSLSSAILYDVGLGVPTFTSTNFFPTFVNGVGFERLHYRFDEYEGRNPQTTSPTVEFEVSIINPFGDSGTIHLVAYQHVRGAGWGGINNFPFGVVGSTLTLLDRHVLDAGSDFASSPINGAEVVSNPRFTDATFGPLGTFAITNLADYVPIDQRTISFGAGVCRRETTITIFNDPAVEFNEDIILRLIRIGNDLPLSPYANIANATLSEHEEEEFATSRRLKVHSRSVTP